MFMSDVNKKEEIQNLALQDLRKQGIKFRLKKQRHHVQDVKFGRHMFKTNLHMLPMQTVTLISGQQLIIPKVVHDMCSFILTKVETEGLFRKGGSKSRQNEIRLSLDAGCTLGDDHHEIDIANVLKTFFRELPESLFPYSHHEPFLRCTLLQEHNKLQAVLLTCLLLPTEHLNMLTYFMQFLHNVTKYSFLNKMDSYNLAVVIGPTIFPIDEKLALNTTHRLTKICELIKMLIDNASEIGLIADDIINRIAPSTSRNTLSDDEAVNSKKKNKRRSGSLTRMLNGLRKIVGSKSVDLVSPRMLTTPDLLSAPHLTKSAKKRKLETVGLSNKKKRELLQKLPQGTSLSTPISLHPKTKEKKSQWNLGNKRNKFKQTDHAVTVGTNKFFDTKAVLERRWSVVSQAAGFRRNKIRNSLNPVNNKKNQAKCEEIATFNTSEVAVDVQQISEPDYVKISRTEYEEIKNRVSAIERRISLELENFPDESSTEKHDVKASDVIVNVQTAYEKTLVESERLSPTTDQLARRLSKELKIRRSCEQKVVRSPSARKIGSLRRRSREFIRQNAKIQRNQSWHIQSDGMIPRINLKRGKPNTINMGLSQPTLFKVSDICVEHPLDTQRIKKAIRQASFHGNVAPSPARYCQRSVSNCQIQSNNTSTHSNEVLSEKWESADGFFSHLKTPNDLDNSTDRRPSLAKLRSQNAGMVLAKAKIFDALVDSDNSADSQSQLSTASIQRVKTATKIGASRNVISHRSRCLRYDENRLGRQSVTPRKRCLKSPKGSSLTNEKENNPEIYSSTEKSQMAVLKDCNRIDTSDFRNKTASLVYTPLNGMPQLKKSLAVRSPKRLCRTPINDNKQTPLRILGSSKRIY